MANYRIAMKSFSKGNIKAGKTASKDTMEAARNYIKPITPFDTGRLEGSYNLSQRSPDLSEDGATALGDGSGPLFLSNNVPYAGRVNDGTERQAANAMLERTAAFSKIHLEIALKREIKKEELP